MATYTHIYQPVGYQIDAYGKSVPENYYAMSTPQPLAWAPLAPVYASAAFFALGQYYAQPAPALPLPPQEYSETYYLPWPQPSAAPPIHTPPSSLNHQQVEAYIQQHDKNKLQVDLNLWDELHALVDEIHTSPTPWRFENPVNSMRSFHVQCEELIELQEPVSALVPHQQEELNVASNILKALNLTRGLFNQLAPCTIGLSACSHANSLFSTFCIWEQTADTNLHSDAPPHPLPANNDHASTHTLSYINKLEAPSSGSAPTGGAPAPEFQSMYPLPAITHHSFASPWLQVHLDHPLSKDDCDPLLS
ncbi:hypothetical protein C0993_005083 [Termitomyces sp. T159_Od127]|nr:hypothetical protein C0993_005083 [Termitomyces sp. T159_Od127]